MRGNLEELFKHLLAIILAPEHVRRFKFHPTRKWRFDFAWPAPHLKIALEVVGGEPDSEKYKEALRLGWRVLKVTKSQIKDGSAIIWLKKLLGETDGETNLG